MTLLGLNMTTAVDTNNTGKAILMLLVTVLSICVTLDISVVASLLDQCRLRYYVDYFVALRVIECCIYIYILLLGIEAYLEYCV